MTKYSMYSFIKENGRMESHMEMAKRSESMIEGMNSTISGSLIISKEKDRYMGNG